MSGQHWPNAMLEREWLAALRWHMQVLLGKGHTHWTTIEPTVGNYVDPISDIEPTSFINVGPTITVNKMPTLVKRMTEH